MMIDTKSIQQLPGLSTLSHETLLAIAQRAYPLNVSTGHNLVIEGMPAESCYFILSGQLRVSRMNNDGRIQVLARFGPGQPINIISLLTAKRVNHATIECITPAELFVLDAEDFDALLAKYPDFSTKLLEIFAKRLARITDLAADLSLYSVRARLAQFLIELANTNQSTEGWTQDEIAAHIGTVRDVVGRLLREFESEGLISRDRQQIILTDGQRLIRESQKFDH